MKQVHKYINVMLLLHINILLKDMKIILLKDMALWCSGYHYCTTLFNKA